MKTKKVVKSIISIFMVICILASFTIMSQAATSSAIYSFYADNMLFQQGETSQIAGTGPAGATITCNIKNNSDGSLVSSSQATVNSSGAFSVPLNAPAGSYNEYTISLYENGSLFRNINNVVFGELWLASGQSNMQMELSSTVEGQSMQSRGEKGSKWVRMLNAQGYTTYCGSISMSAPYGQEDIPGCYWTRGCDSNIYNYSAVAFHFAEKLQADLNMPVGVLSANLGGSYIASWLPRSAIEGDANVLYQVNATNQYIGLNSWSTNTAQNSTMTANYNMKIYPLRRFKISGMIWYQGESDVMAQPGMDYSIMFNALQNSYTSNFNYTKGSKLPIVFTEIAAYPYTAGSVNNAAGVMIRNYQYAQIKNSSPSTRALTTINDVALDYSVSTGSIHPITKKPVGLRMAYAAAGLVYNKSNIKGAPTLKGSNVSGNAFYLTMSNVGDGLVTDGKKLSGFSICGSNGVYVEAEAKIVSTNVVKVWNEKITSPAAVSYKTGSTNQSANLYSSLNGNRVMPAETFNTSGNLNYPLCWGYADWTNCEKSVAWHNIGTAVSAYYPTWTTTAGSIDFQSGSAFSGSAGIRLTAGAGVTANLEPNINYISLGNNNLTTYKFDDTYNSWTYYTSCSFMVRNNTSYDAAFGGMINYTSYGGFFVPAYINGLFTYTGIIPADGQWHEFVIDLTHQFYNGDLTNWNYSTSLSNLFSEVLRTVFVFTSTYGLDLSIDDFRFGTANSNTGIYRSKETSHNMYSWYTAKQPTCTSTGYSKRVCQNADCDYYETSTIGTTSHNTVTQKGYAATCTSTGLTDGSYCSTCGQVFSTQTTIPKLDHSYGDWSVVEQPSCTTTGTKTKTCVNCKTATVTEVIGALGHTPVTDARVNPSCVLTGLTEGSHCSVCKAVLTAQEEIPVLGHTVGDWETVTPSTCSVAGLKTKTCSVCKEVLESEEIEKLPHTPVTDEAVEATCTQTGLTEGSHCSVCQEVLVAVEVVSKKPHKAVAKEYAEEPSCTTSGKVNYRCEKCNKKLYTVDVEALGHTPGDWEIVTPATFEIEGLKAQKCSKCQEIINSEVIPVLDSASYEVKNDSNIVIDEVNKLIIGVEQGEADLEQFFNLTNCTFEYQETISGFGTGTTVSVVSVLGEIIDTYTVVVIGDITGDGYVDAFDVSSVSEYINNFDEPSEIAYKKAVDSIADDFLDATDLAFIISLANFE